jgi:ubiquinone/menaquinone biosynthesis C-methylase UbiE
VEAIAASNQESHEAWNGPLFERWMTFRDIVTEGLGRHGDLPLELHPPAPGDDVLDIGCGTGETSNQIVEMVGPEGSVFGVDVAEQMIDVARREAEEAGVPNLRFEVADAQIADFEQTFDYAYSRMGVMFFAQPVIALRNIREALKPGGRLSMAVWRRKIENDWMHRAELIVKDFVEEPEETDEPTCGPGPFSMADADTVSQQLLSAGFEQIEFHRCDVDIRMGNDLDHAVDFVMALGPAGEALRLAGEEADAIRPKITKLLHEGLAEFVQPDGTVSAPASTWTISAVVA